MKQNKKSGFALIAGIGVIALIAIVGFLVIKSNVIDPAKNAAAVVKANVTKTNNTDTYGPNCPDCSAQENSVKEWTKRVKLAEKQSEEYGDQYIDGKGSTKNSDYIIDYSYPPEAGELPAYDRTNPKTIASQAKLAKYVRDRTRAKLAEAQKALDECIEKKKIYCDGYNDGKDANKTTEADKAKAAEEANAARQRALVR